jgi:nitrogen-specific signal transduction histidine kinase
MIDKMPASILVAARDGKILFSNDAALPILLHYADSTQATLNAEGLQLLKKIDSPAVAEAVEIQETGMTLEVTISLLSEESDQYLFFGRDVTRERELEREKAELSKKEVVAATITTYAHEIGNPLAIAVGYTSFPYEKLNEGKLSKVRHALGRIRTALEAIRAAAQEEIAFEKYLDDENMLKIKKTG